MPDSSQGLRKTSQISPNTTIRESSLHNGWLWIFTVVSLSIESWLSLKQWTVILDKSKESYEGISGVTVDTICIPSPPGDLERHILDHNSQSYEVLFLRGALSLSFIRQTFTEHLYVAGTVSSSQLEWYFPYKGNLELCGRFFDCENNC